MPDCIVPPIIGCTTPQECAPGCKFLPAPTHEQRLASAMIALAQTVELLQARVDALEAAQGGS